jgi:uncharacterized membrane protein YoaK (UPF0700 family)
MRRCGAAEGDAMRVVGQMAFASMIAALAGAVDAFGYLRLNHLFVSFMSGNTTILGAALAGYDRGQVLPVATILVMFVLGATGGTVLATLAGRLREPAVLLAVALLLAVAAWRPVAPAVPVALAMGMLNAAMRGSDGLPGSLTYVTGTLVHFGEGLGAFICRTRSDLGWLVQAATWPALLVGSFAGAMAQQGLADGALWCGAAVAALLAALAPVIPTADAPRRAA